MNNKHIQGLLLLLIGTGILVFVATPEIIRVLLMVVGIVFFVSGLKKLFGSHKHHKKHGKSKHNLD